MAGEIEEPFSFNFLADSVHSGSISFGRFECEPLSWERRSSFSHNRYLEEVEKCSKPGSVTEKKAHFEAFFKNKALLSQISNEGQNGTERQNSNNDVSEISISYREECEHVSESESSYYYDESPNSSDTYENEQERSHVNEGNSFIHLEESPNVSDTNEEFRAVFDERENTEKMSKSEPKIALAFISSDTIEADFKHDKSMDGKIHVESAKLVTEVKEILISETVTIDDVSKSTDSFHPNISEERPCLSQQSLAARENKFMKTISKFMVNGSQPRKNIRAKPSEDSLKNHSRGGKQTVQVIKSVERPSPTSDQTLCPVRRTSLPPESRLVQTKLSNESKRSVRDIQTKKVVEARAGDWQKDESEPCRIQNRTKQIVKPSPVKFSFKSDERAERRKEFFVKLGKKTHVKEAEMNQIQAKTQEKTDAEIRQFRKSLNFKATPMPSFYLETTQPQSYKSKSLVRPTSSRSDYSNAGRTSSSCHMAGIEQNAVNADGKRMQRKQIPDAVPIRNIRYDASNVGRKELRSIGLRKSTRACNLTVGLPSIACTCHY